MHRPERSSAREAVGTTSAPPTVPRSVRLVAWGNAAVLGHVSLDEAVDRVVGSDTLHRVHGLPGEPEAVGLSLALGRLRADGARGLRLALPVPGDPAGLPGPAAFNEAALDAGEAVLTAGLPAYGLLPGVEPLGSSGTGVRWRAYDVAPARVDTLPSLADAERELAQAIREVTALLAELDVARWDAQAVAAVQQVREDPRPDGLAPGYPPRAYRSFALARRIGVIAALAQRSTGGAVTAGEMARRADALTPLEHASRRAMVAACNAVLEPRRD